MEVSRDDAIGPEEVAGGLSLDGDPVEVLAGLAREAVVADNVVVEALNLALRDAERNVLTWKRVRDVKNDHHEDRTTVDARKLAQLLHMLNVPNSLDPT